MAFDGIEDAATAIRLMVIGQEMLIAAVFLLDGKRRPGRISGAALVLGVAAYLFVSDPALAEQMPLLRPVAMLLALAVPYSMWLFAQAVFEFRRPSAPAATAVATVVLTAWLVILAGDRLAGAWVRTADVVLHLLSIAVVVHALWLTARGRLDDLLERRRAFRLLFIALIATQVFAVLLVELLASGATPYWLEFLNVLVIALLTLGLAVPILSLDNEFFARSEDRARRTDESDRHADSVSDRVLERKLEDVMTSGYYREPGVTIRRLAEELGYPEHQLRRLINGRLGFRNFSAFLNSHRVSDAKGMLADPDRARTPVLTIALELGYGSVGPFNRAFRQATGMTPTEYRRSKLLGDRTDSE